MTLIDIGRTINILVSLAQAEKISNQLYEEAGQIGIQLGNLSGMQQVRRTLEYIMEDMEEEYRVMGQMNRYLEETCRTFQKYEEEIAEYAEEASMQNGREPILKAIRIPDNIFRLLR